jgi:hypothetical protein
VREGTTRRGLLPFAALLAAGIILLAGPSSVSGAGGDTISQPPVQTLAPGGSATLPSQTLHLDGAPPKADILIAFDTTGSMGAAIADARRDAASIVNTIHQTIPGARFAIADFQDYRASPFGSGSEQDPPWKVDQGFTADAQTIQNAVNNISACFCGGDFPEAYNTAYYQAYSDRALTWDPTAPRFMVVLGDSYGHDPSQAVDFGSTSSGGISQPNCPATSPIDPGPPGVGPLGTLPTLTTLKNTYHTNLSFVTYNPTADPGSNKVLCHRALAEFTGGSEVTHDSGTGPLGDQIVGLINQAAAKIDQITFAATPVSAPAGAHFDPTSWVSFDPPLPYGPTLAPTSINFDETITVPQDAPVGQYVFNVAASADNALRATQTVTVNVVQGMNPHLSVDEQALPAGVATAPFSKIPASRIPFFSGATTSSTPYGATPYGATPFGATPFGATPFGATPWGATPFGATPYGATPYGATPFGATPWGATPFGATGLGTTTLGASPFGATPYGATDVRNPLNQVLLSQIPLTNPSDGASWPQVLGNSPLAASPLNSTTLGAVARDTTVGTDGKKPWDRLAALPAKDVPFLSSVWQGIPVGAIVLGNATLGQIPDPDNPSAVTPADRAAAWATTIQNSGGCTGCTSADNTFFGIAAAGALGSTKIGAIPFGATPFGATAGGAITLSTMNIAGTRLAAIRLSSITPPADIVNCSATGLQCSTGTLADAVQANAIVPTATLGKLLGDIPATDPARQITVDEIVAAVLPFTAYPWEQIPVQGLQDVAGTNKNAHYHVDFSLSCATSAFRVDVDLGSGFFPVQGTTTIAYGDGAAQTVADPTLTRDVGKRGLRATVTGSAPACSGATRTVHLSFAAFTGLQIGDQPSTARVTALGKTEIAPEHAPVLVTQNQEANDDPATAPTIASDALVVGHVANSGDKEYYRFPLSGVKANTRIVAFLKVPNGADLDLTMNAPSQAAVESTPFGATSLSGPPVPDQAVGPDNSSTSPQANTLADIPFGATPFGATPFGATAAGSVSQNRGSDPESAAIVVHQASTGFVTIGVTGYNGSFSDQPYVLRLEVLPPPPLPACPARTGLGTPAAGTMLPAPSSLPSDAKTLFLVNRQRLAGLYTPDAANALVNTDPNSPLNQLAARPEVKGTILTVDANATVRSAYSTWDASPCSPEAANSVVTSINDLVATYRAARPSLKYVVLLGTDTAVPMYRQSDPSVLSPELDYAQSLAFTTSNLTKGNALYAAAAQNQVLTDGAYGAFTRITWLDHDLPLPQVSVSRLVESPSEILGQIGQYLTSNGVLNPKSALTTGYDFLADGAALTNDALGDSARLPGVPAGSGLTRDTLISPDWTKADLVNHFFGLSPLPDIAAANGHYNHFAFKPASPEDTTSLAQVATTADAAGKTLNNHVIFSVGCHGGLNVADELGLIAGSPDAPQYLDWAQTYSQDENAVFVANSGFGYGDTETVAASERLMALFAQNLNAGSSYIGDNWLNALTSYFLTTGIYSAVDEKVMLEATFYGLPFYHFGSAPTPAPPGGTPPTSDGVVDSSSYSPPTTAGRVRHDLPNGTSFWSGSGGTIAVPYRSIQPLVTKDVSVAGKEGRGAWVTSLTTHDVGGVTPAVAHWTFDSSRAEPRPNFQNTFWPASPAEVQHTTTPGGADRSFLDINAGAFRPTDATSGFERLIDSIGVRVTYGPANSPDPVTAFISQSGAVQTPGDPTRATIFVRASDSLGVHIAAALYNDGTANPDGSITWTYLELPQVSPGFFVASVSGLHGPIELGTEVMNNAGGVSQSWNKAANFHEVIDSGTGPSIVISNPLPGQTFVLNQQVKPDIACSDESAVSSCTSSPLVNGNIDTTTIGEHQITVTATDLAGNTSSRIVKYTVQYAFVGFRPPVDNPPVLNTVKAGSTVPIKWRLQDAAGNSVSDLSAVTAISFPSIPCTAAPTDAIETTVAPGLAGLTYDTIEQQFALNWQTMKTSTGCLRVQIEFADGTARYADFKFK